MNHLRLMMLILSLFLLLALPGCLSSEDMSDIPEPETTGWYVINYCTFCQKSRLPLPQPKPALRIGANHPRLAVRPWHLRPLSYGTIRALYDNLNDYEVRVNYTVSYLAEAGAEQDSKDADIVFWRRTLDGKADESLSGMRKNRADLIEHAVAKDALVFFTNKKNPVNNISLDQIRGIYPGKVKNWKELGGRYELIKAYQRQNYFNPWRNFYAISQFIMKNEVMGAPPIMPQDRHQVSNITGYSENEVIEYRNHSNALGYALRWSLEMNVPPEMLKRIKILTLDGVYTSEENIKSERYPLTFDILAFAAKKEASPETRAVLDWLISPEGREYIRQIGYVPY